MPSLSERLKALGVKVGAQDLPLPQPRVEYSVAAVVPGSLIETHQGPVYLAEQRYPAIHQHGATSLNIRSSLHNLARWAGDPQISLRDLQAFAFLDTETSGLAGGTGTYAFLVGVARFEGDSFHLAQFFMRDPSEETGLLAALEEFLAPCQVVVTFNGKAFDVPLLNTRYTLQGWRSPLVDFSHVDLLPLARRLWRERLPSRTLGNLEVQILGAQRTEEEVPGWMIPQLYFDYLRTGDARQMKNVFYHNAMDVISLAALLNHTTHLLDDPLQVEDGLEQSALGRLFEDLGDDELAAALYKLGLVNDLPEPIYWDTLQRLSFLYKRRGDLEHAMELWQKAAQKDHLYAHVELAKVCEHVLRDYQQAAQWTLVALDKVREDSFPIYERQSWLPELEHRLNRLQRRLAGLVVPSIESENDEGADLGYD